MLHLATVMVDISYNFLEKPLIYLKHFYTSWKNADSQMLDISFIVWLS